MDITELKALLKQADEDSQAAHQDFGKRSTAHKAALEIMKFEKDLYYGDLGRTHHRQKIKDIIDLYAEEIVNETDKSENK
ncbi:CxC ATPase DNA modification system associated small protein [Vibrio hibernica]|uniref:CxC ATPase DNA modification system associated small protein n=1 Tax=Vibrio hibernica TaxID=2587465 RepID=UPI0039AFF64A